ncbi:MAG TPA: biotin-independent malonate decarboxylase subunit gamma, partial [Casimicrobiaceae bacterium]
MEWASVAERLFDRGHDIVATGDLLSGTGHCGDTIFTVVGSTNHAEIGVELTVAMAKRVIETMREHPSRPILFLIDTQGQRLRH